MRLSGELYSLKSSLHVYAVVIVLISSNPVAIANNSHFTLDLPSGNSGFLTGSEILSDLSSKPHTETEQFIRDEILKGNIPDWLRELIPVTVSNTNHEITFFVTADYLSVGDDSDYFTAPMTPMLAQQIADSADAILPTRKMADLIWDAAPLKLTPFTLSPSEKMTTLSGFAEHNKLIQSKRNAFLEKHPLGTLTAGSKKDIIISDRYYNYQTPRVIIYGWHKQNGSPIQPVSGIHDIQYVDYSHGVRLISRFAILDGKKVRIDDVLTDAKYAPLISDEGRMEHLHYPVK